MSRPTEHRPCALCGRLVRHTTKHHLIPKSAGGRVVVDLCVPCHKTLHSFFKNKTLRDELHTLEALRQDSAIAHYLTWIRKQPDSAIRIRKSRQRR